MNNIKRLLALSSIIFAVGSAYAFVDQSDYNNLSGYYSAGAPGAFVNFAQYEDFTIVGPETIRQISWWGMTEDWSTGVLEDNISGFVVSVFSHDAVNNRPDLAGTMYTNTFALGSTNVMDIGPGYGGVSEAHSHYVDTPDINLVAGTYWLHVGATYIDGVNEHNWAWMNTLSNYSGTHANRDWGTGAWGATADDMAMSLSSVPEPGTFVAIGLGLAGLLVARRRK